MNPKAADILQIPGIRQPYYDELLEFVWEIRKCLGTKEINLEYWNREASKLFTEPQTPEKYS